MTARTREAPRRPRTQTFRQAARVWLAAIVLPLAATAGADTLTVDCNGGAAYLTLQAAVDAAASGDSIQVAPCAYAESVELQGKLLTLLGGGADNTTLLGAGSAPTLHNTTDITLQDLRIETSPESDYAILCDENKLTLSRCTVTAPARVGSSSGALDIDASSLTWVWVTGGGRGGYLRNSHFDGGYFSGIWLGAYNGYVSSNCSYGRISLGPQSTWESSGDSIQYVRVDGTVDVSNDFSAVDSIIDTCLATQSPQLRLTGCTVHTLAYDTAMGYGPFLRLQGCLVLGDCPVRLPSPKAGAVGRSVPIPIDGYLLEHNTITGDLDIAIQESVDPSEESIRSNLVLGHTTIRVGSQPFITHNDFVGGSSIDAPVAIVDANLEADPKLCAPGAGDYTLDGMSPCVDAAHDGGDIGAFGVGCQVPVRSITWGRLKARF